MNEQIEKGKFRCESKHRMTRRCEGWNYCSRLEKCEVLLTRRDALVLNRLAQALAGDGAAAINYHGATFAEIDSLARLAVSSRYPKRELRGKALGLSPETPRLNYLSRTRLNRDVQMHCPTSS